MKFYSQLDTSGREPSTCDKPVSHSIDIPTEELKSNAIIGTSASSHTTRSDSQAHRQSNLYTHVNSHTDNEISEYKKKKIRVIVIVIETQ